MHKKNSIGRRVIDWMFEPFHLHGGLPYALGLVILNWIFILWQIPVEFTWPAQGISVIIYVTVIISIKVALLDSIPWFTASVIVMIFPWTKQEKGIFYLVFSTLVTITMVVVPNIPTGISWGDFWVQNWDFLLGSWFISGCFFVFWLKRSACILKHHPDQGEVWSGIRALLEAFRYKWIAWATPILIAMIR